MTSILRLLAVAILLSLPITAASKPVEMRWNELAPVIGGARVEVILNDGMKIKGEVVAVREDALLLDTKGTSNVPRVSVVQINVERKRGVWGRTLGTVFGILTGMTLGTYAAVHTDTARGAIPTFLGVSAGVGTGGYYVGKWIDRRTLRIRVVPQ
jgi:hypothetical protein